MAVNDGFDLYPRGIFIALMTIISKMVIYFCRFEVKKFIYPGHMMP